MAACCAAAVLWRCGSLLLGFCLQQLRLYCPLPILHSRTIYTPPAGTNAACAAHYAAGGWGPASDAALRTRIPNKNVQVINNIVYNPAPFESQVGGIGWLEGERGRRRLKCGGAGRGTQCLIDCRLPPCISRLAVAAL